MSSAGSSSTSGATVAGRTTVSTPSRSAASSFSFSPPTGSTCPVRVISPERATLGSTGTCTRAESSAVATAMPADGPSLGTPPSGKCMRTSSAESSSWSDGCGGSHSARLGSVRAGIAGSRGAGPALDHPADAASAGSSPAGRRRRPASSPLSGCW